jgi:hypothetical protein
VSREKIMTRKKLLPPLLAVIVLSAPSAAAPAPRQPELHAESMSVVASIAETGVRVRCTISDAFMFEPLGHADWKRRLIELAPSVCRKLNALVARPAPPYSEASFAQAESLLVLVHESVHVSDYAGRTNEALTECRAIQLVREAARTLGVDDVTARALGHEAMRYDAQLPGPGHWLVGLREFPNYHSSDCYDGGPLDIHPDSQDWPN